MTMTAVAPDPTTQGAGGGLLADELAAGLLAAVVRATCTDDVVHVVRTCLRHGVPVVARGPGTGLSGGANAVEGCVVLSLDHIDYLLAAPLGPREGAVVVWAGMRGAVSLAAAQTLPAETPDRPLLVLVAFLVAAGSLLLQGGTLGRVVRRVHPAAPDPAAEDAERSELLVLLRAVVEDEPLPADRTAALGVRLRQLATQRDLLLRARDDGRFSTAVLGDALTDLDATQMALELRAGRAV